VIGAVFVLWVTLSRVSVGDRLPADVIAGSFVGLAIVFVVRRLLHRALPLSA
jgi:predicted HAD superfamily phosphohydrolase YqeG